MPEHTSPVAEFLDVPRGMIRSTRDTGKHGAIEAAVLRAAEQAASDDKSSRGNSGGW